MNYKKIILVGCISAFVAVLTSVMGVAGTIIGSVISSVLYNMLTEALEKPVGQATFSTDFEWEIAYIFPLVVIALIQLLFILALRHGSKVRLVDLTHIFHRRLRRLPVNQFSILQITISSGF